MAELSMRCRTYVIRGLLFSVCWGIGLFLLNQVIHGMRIVDSIYMISMIVFWPVLLVAKIFQQSILEMTGSYAPFVLIMILLWLLTGAMYGLVFFWIIKWCKIGRKSESDNQTI